MFVYDVTFPHTDALILEAFETALTTDYSDGLTVQPDRPATMTRRVVTLRNDGGPQGRQLDRGYGANLWADTLVDAMNMARVCASVARGLPGTYPFSRAFAFTDPVRIDDDPQFTAQVSGKTKSLEHVYFTFTVGVKPARP